MEYPHPMFSSHLRIFESNVYNYNKNKIKTTTIILEMIRAGLIMKKAHLLTCTEDELLNSK